MITGVHCHTMNIIVCYNCMISPLSYHEYVFDKTFEGENFRGWNRKGSFTGKRSR